MTVDCSPGAVEERRKWLAALREKRFSGVSSLGDRGRSVNYYDPEQLNALITSLENEAAICDGTFKRRMGPRRVFTPPYSKWL